MFQSSFALRQFSVLYSCFSCFIEVDNENACYPKSCLVLFFCFSFGAGLEKKSVPHSLNLVKCKKRLKTTNLKGCVSEATVGSLGISPHENQTFICSHGDIPSTSQSVSCSGQTIGSGSFSYLTNRSPPFIFIFSITFKHPQNKQLCLVIIEKSIFLDSLN